MRVAWKYYRDLFKRWWKSMISIWAYLKGRDNQHSNMARNILRKSIPQAWILHKSRLDECNSMLHDDWWDIPCVCCSFVLFCSRPGKVSDKNTRRNIFIIIFLCSLQGQCSRKVGIAHNQVLWWGIRILLVIACSWGSDR